MPVPPSSQPARPRVAENEKERIVPKLRSAPPARILVLDPQPVLDGGRHAPKRTVGESVAVQATIFADGHDVLRAVVRAKAPGARRWHEAPMVPVDREVAGDRWAGTFTVDRLGRWTWTIEAWVDAFASWRDELSRKLAAGQEDLAGELSEGVVALRDAA